MGDLKKKIILLQRLPIRTFSFQMVARWLTADTWPTKLFRAKKEIRLVVYYFLDKARSNFYAGLQVKKVWVEKTGQSA